MPHQPRWRIFILAASYIFYGWWDWHFIAAAGALDGRQPVRSPARSTPRNRPGRASCCSWVAVVGNLGRSRTSSTTTSSSARRKRAHRVRDRRRADDHRRRAAGRDLVLHVHGAVATSSTSYRGDREPATLIDFAVYLSFFPHLVAGPIVRADEFIPQLDVRRDPRRVDVGRAVVPDPRRPVQEGGDLELPGARRSSTRCSAIPTRHGALETLFAIYGYAVADLRRLQRLHRHRDRRRAAARLPVPAELRPAVHAPGRCRTSGAGGT